MSKESGSSYCEYISVGYESTQCEVTDTFITTKVLTNGYIFYKLACKKM